MRWMHRVRLYPTVAQEERLGFMLDVTRQTYNALLDERRYAWTARRIAVSSKEQYAETTALRAEDARFCVGVSLKDIATTGPPCRAGRTKPRRRTPRYAMTEVRYQGELPLYRLYVMRVAYLVIGLGQGAKTWPAILHHAHPWDFWHGVAVSFFGALTLLCLLGVRCPVRMMPLLIFEFTWKAIWVLAAWLPPWLGHALDPDIGDSFLQISLGVVIVPLVLPLGYVWKNYVLAPADRWK